MKQIRMTRQRLEYLMRNWGVWQRSLSRVGPSASLVCGSAERRYASDAERYVWEGRSTVPRETPDDPVLAELTEEVVAQLVARHRRVIVERYVSEHSLRLVAARMGMSETTAEALLDAALADVMFRLEEASWASGC